MPSDVAIVPAVTQLEIWVLFLTQPLNVSSYFFRIEVLFLIYPLPSENKKHSRLHNCPHYCHISHSLKTRLLQLSVFEPSPVLTQSSPTHSKLYSSSGVQHSKIFAHTPVLKSLNWLKIEQIIQ